jgi:pimeloyl-ACP methyl ester carboxylesterase
VITESVIRVAADPAIDLFLATMPGPPDKVLLVIHGGPDWYHSYLRVPLDRLAGTRRVLLPDLRGCGRSTSGLALADYSWDAAVRDLLGLLDALGIDRADVLGFSTGGSIAQRLALAAPGRVGRLIVASSSALPVSEDALDPDLREQQAARLAQGEALGPDPGELSGAAVNRANALRSAPANVWRPEKLAEYLERLAQVRFTGEWLPGWHAGILGPARPEDSAKRLAALGIPILLLHGRQDLTFPAALALAAADMIPAARAVVLESAGHMAHIDQPDAWLTALRDFLE